MSRWTTLFTSLTLSAAFAAVVIAACGGRPISPGEMPPLAPRPERVDPMALPVPSGTDPATPLPDAGRPLSPTRGPISALSAMEGVALAAASRSPHHTLGQPGGSPPTGAPPPGGGQPPRDAGAAGAPDAPSGAPDAAAPPPPSPGPPADASIDAYGQPLPPIPDGGLPADSRLEPIRLRD
jgi:hypothetical protein